MTQQLNKLQLLRLHGKNHNEPMNVTTNRTTHKSTIPTNKNIWKRNIKWWVTKSYLKTSLSFQDVTPQIN